MMELNVVESKKNRLVFELPGTDHTFCNALKAALWEDKDVKVATYTVKHPLVPIPKFILETTKKEPKKALVEAVGNMQKQYKDISQSFAKAL